MIKFSYSSISTYNQCPYKYKLSYIDKHYINQPTIATDFGTLIHFIEETIANKLKNCEPINYSELINIFYNIDTADSKSIATIAKDYPDDFESLDKSGRTYKQKSDLYATSTIYRLEKYLKDNPNLEIVAAEKEFNLTYRGYIFHGFIDRLFLDKLTGKYIIEDIKTYSKPLEKSELATPLQFVIYAQAVHEMFDTWDIECAYDLPLCDCKQQAGTKDFIARGFKKIDKLLDQIEAKVFPPKPSPLCHWCVFSDTYKNQPDAAKNLCPYFCHWTREHKTMEVEYEWMGEENHKKILETFIDKHKELITETRKPVLDIQKIPNPTKRYKIIR